MMHTSQPRPHHMRTVTAQALDLHQRPSLTVLQRVHTEVLSSYLYEPALIRRRELPEPCKSGGFVKPSLRTDD